jgi:hypothetical protein
MTITSRFNEGCYEVCLQSKRRINLSFRYDKFVNAGGGTIDGTATWLGESTAGGPDTKVKITEAYADLAARDAYFWAWPMVNMYNRRQAYQQLTEPIMLGPVPAAPLNRLAMLRVDRRQAKIVPLQLVQVRPQAVKV